MRLHRTAVLLSLIAAIGACAARQDGRRGQEPAPAPSREDPSPMAPFARMIPGEWMMTVASGTSSFHAWHWGPGRYSMRVMTDGLDAAGNQWRDLSVFHWHPGHKQVREFGASPFARGITDGAIRFEGETAQSDFDLFQTGGRRRLRAIWTFDGPDKYHAALMEATPIESSKFTTLVEWDLFRTEPPTPPRPFAVEGATGPSDLLHPLEPLIGAWETKSDAASADRSQSTVQWIPLADAIYVKVTTPSQEGGPEHIFDAYLYHHTGIKTLRCLALSNRGGVYEGDITALEGGALQFDLKGYEGDRVIPYTVRLDFELDGTVHQRVWSLAAAERTLVLDIHHTKPDAK